MNQILIIQTAFLGDVILATPVASELKRLYPNAHIDMLVKKGNESLLANHESLRDVLVLDKSSGKRKEIRRLKKQIRSTRYDLLINLQRFGSSGLIAGWSRAKEIRGFKKNPFSFRYHKKFEHTIGDGTHEVERNLSLIQDLGASTITCPSLYPSDDDFKTVENYASGEYYCLAPASVWFTKQLPENKWLELIDSLPAESSLYLLGGPDDKELCERIKGSREDRHITNLAGKLSLLQSAAIMKKAERSFVNDSGPLHLASSVDAPVTAFFCSTIPDFGFGPLSTDSEILEVTDLDCRPCGLHGHKSCPKGHFKCSEINVAQ